MADAQVERAFQKQEGVFLASKKLQAKKTSSGVRFYKKIGLGKFSEAISSSSPRRRDEGASGQEHGQWDAAENSRWTNVDYFAGFKTPAEAIDG